MARWLTPDEREELRQRLDRYLDLPLALASIVLVLLAIIEVAGIVGPPWAGWLAVLGWVLWGLFAVEFAVKLALAPAKRRYIQRNWLDALVVLLPFLRVFKALRILRLGTRIGTLRLLVFGGRSSSAALELLRRRRLGQLALITGIVILLGATLGFLLEQAAPATQMLTFGDALWWAAALVTTVGTSINPVTAGGRILAFVLMVYAMAVFTYFTASLASVLVGIDARQPPPGLGGASPAAAPPQAPTPVAPTPPSSPAESAGVHDTRPGEARS